MKFNFKDIDKKWKEYALAGCVCVLFYVVLTHLGTFGRILSSAFRMLKPVFVGFVVAYIINPLAVFFEKKLFKNIKNEKLRWNLSAVLTVVIVLLIIAVLIASLIPQLVENISSLAENYPSYIASLETFIVNHGIEADVINRFFSLDGPLVQKIGEVLSNNASKILAATTNVGSAAANTLIGMIFAVYFLMAKSSIAASFRKLFVLLMSKLSYTKFSDLIVKFNTIFSKYIVCELLDTLIVGIVTYVFMLITKMPDALFIAVVAGVTNLAPTFGPIVGTVVAAFILLLLKPSVVIMYIIFSVVLQTVDGYIIKPKLFGGVLNVPGFIILIAIIVFGKIMGVGGMLIAIPVAAIIVYVYTQNFIPWLELKRDLKEFRKEQEKETPKNN